MLRIITYTLSVLALMAACDTAAIKNETDAVAVEEGTAVPEHEELPVATAVGLVSEALDNKQALLGNWVGDFEDANPDADKIIFVDAGFEWNRTNKISISIDKIDGERVKGHSVVAGNNRPFEGTVVQHKDKSYQFEVREPGDDRYDGAFTFFILDNKLKGVWNAYKNIEIPKREYDLRKKPFVYNPDIMLEYAQSYIDWNKSIEAREVMERYEDGSVEEWIISKFATTTEAAYDLNASNTRLTKEQVENLKRGDLTILRNTIYARHGYSFKRRPLRVFFDAQPWYIPVHTDIRSDFTDLEKENIELLLRYEKNAAEYYDSFGRG